MGEEPLKILATTQLSYDNQPPLVGLLKILLSAALH